MLKYIAYIYILQMMQKNKTCNFIEEMLKQERNYNNSCYDNSVILSIKWVQRGGCQYVAEATRKRVTLCTDKSERTIAFYFIDLIFIFNQLPCEGICGWDGWVRTAMHSNFYLMVFEKRMKGCLFLSNFLIVHICWDIVAN